MIGVYLTDTDDGLGGALAAERARLVRLCAYLSGDKDAAEDLAQETLLEAWRLRARLTDSTGYQAWLSAIARNVCLRWRRTSHAAAHTLSDKLSLDKIVDASDFEADLERHELAALLDRALALLPAGTRDILIARYIAESPLSEVAGRLGMTENGVAVRLHRGKLALRRVLAGEMREEVAEHAATDWQPTPLWCPLCGKQKLVGKLPHVAGEFYLRCPDCQPDTDESMSRSSLLSVFAGVKGFKAVLNRQMAWAYRFEMAAFHNNGAACYACGKPMRLTLAPPPEAPPSAQQRRGFHLRCTACNALSSSSLTGRALYLPGGRRFWETHRRIHVLPQQEIEVDGQPAIRVSFASLDGSATYSTIVARETYRVLKIYE